MSYISSGQIIATSHEFSPKMVFFFKREIPLFQGNLGWWNIIIWPDLMVRIKNIFDSWKGRLKRQKPFQSSWFFQLFFHMNQWNLTQRRCILIWSHAAFSRFINPFGGNQTIQIYSDFPSYSALFGLILEWPLFFDQLIFPPDFFDRIATLKRTDGRRKLVVIF